jgi:hypothetical protein
MDFYSLVASHKNEILTTFLTYCCYNCNDNNNSTILKSEMINVYKDINNTNKRNHLFSQCIRWNGTVARKKTKYGSSLTPIFKFKKYNIQVNAKKASVFLYTGIISEKRKKDSTICKDPICINPYHLVKIKEYIKKRKKIII